MKKPPARRLTAGTLLLALALAACSGPVPPTATQLAPQPTVAPVDTTAPTPTAGAAPTGDGPVSVSGTFTYTNDIITTYYVEHAVAMLDMYGFVTRDRDWLLPVGSQALGYLKLDEEKKEGQFQLQLPARPAGESSDVNHDGSAAENVQVFVVGYSPNLTGGPFSEGDDASRGWPSYLASVKTDSENNDEVTGGKLVVWAEGAGQTFPSSFGADGLLFTADDPLGSLPAGYSIVDLDQAPFDISQEAQAQLTLYEPQDAAVKDYSSLSYTQAFEQLFNKVSSEWAFNDVPAKQVDWRSVHEAIAPRVAAAETAADPLAFFQAIQDFAGQIPDGHTGVGGGELANQEFVAHSSSGYGFAIRELDDGRVIAVYVAAGGPAAAAGLTVGAEVTRFNEESISQAIDKVVPYGQSFSLPASRRYEQMRYLLRAPMGTEATVTFANPGQAEQTVTLAAVNERASFDATSIYQGYDRNALPVEAEILASGVGYIKIDSNLDDLQLILRLFERALEMFDDNQVPGVIIDLRQNPGGAPLGLAGFFSEEEITLGQLEYYSDQSGEFEPEGEPDIIRPNEHQYRFDKLAVLVGPACASACEIEAYGFSQLPGAIVVGFYPTAGVEAEVARGQFKLPEGIEFQTPTGRFVNPDGSLFLEGQGVPPTVRVPLTANTLLSKDDVVLRYAEDEIFGIGAGSLELPGGAVAVSASAAATVIRAGAKFLEDLALEDYPAGQLSQAGRTYTYTVVLDKDQRLIWIAGWCADTEAGLAENLAALQIAFSANGQPVDAAQFAKFEGQVSEQQFCHFQYTAIYQWPSGLTRLSTQVTITQPINDGSADFPAGTHTYLYEVSKP
jgi:C-terminal processing protease CtpA/Prc